MTSVVINVESTSVTTAAGPFSAIGPVINAESIARAIAGPRISPLNFSSESE